jgi:lysozyme
MSKNPENEHLRISPAGLALIKKWEGWYPKAYKDPVGVWTIGWGTIGVEARPGRTITKKQGEEFLLAELKDISRYVKNYVKVPLNQYQFDALVSLVYNIGPGNFSRSTLLKMVNRKQFAAAAAQFARHNTAKDRETGKRIVLKGLTNRRLDEALLFQLATDEDPPWELDTEKQAALVEPQNYDGNVQPSDPAPEEGAWTEVVTQSDTFKTVALTATGFMTAVSQLLEPIAENPVLFGGMLVIILGLAGTLYVKHRDTAEGR